jgi:hypothetical protein
MTTFHPLLACGLLTATCAAASFGAPADDDLAPFSVSDYDAGDVYLVRDGTKQRYNGTRESWVFNRAMSWLDKRAGLDDAIICHGTQSPLVLTGGKGASRWFGPGDAALESIGDDVTRLVKTGDTTTWDHAHLPPLQFQIEQNPAAELEVVEATHPWQLVIVVKGRSGPPFYASPWQARPGKLTVDLLGLYRQKGYTGHYAQLHFFVAVRTDGAAGPSIVDFRLRLSGREAVAPCLPIIRTAARAEKEGVPVYAVVLDRAARRLDKDAIAVTATLRNATITLAEKDGVWEGRFRNVPVGEHQVQIEAFWKPEAAKRTHWLIEPGHRVKSRLDVRVTEGRFLGYDPQLCLLTKDGKPLGPLSGSYRSQVMVTRVGTDAEALVQGGEQWRAVQGDRHEGQHFNHGGPNYTFHFWESFTEREMEADYAYLARCGWNMTHLCQGAWVWERLDAGGRLAPYGAEQLFRLLGAARRHCIYLHFALSHYPLGAYANVKPYAQYLEAGYQKADYANPDSKFYEMFRAYLAQFAAVFRDDDLISSYTASGEGDVACGKTFVNAVYDFMRDRDPRHLFLCEPHRVPKPYPSDVNYYRKDGWKPLLGGMRTYMIDFGKLPVEHVGVQFKLGAMGHVFLAEGVFWGFMDAARQTDRYRQRVRAEFYTGLAYRNPIQLTWEERVVEDERVVFEQVRRAMDWTKPFARPRLAVRIGKDLGELVRYERALTRLPLEYAFLLKDDPTPPGTLLVLDGSEPFQAPAFASTGGKLPNELQGDMPLRLPTGFVANYSWSEDRRWLLAFVRDAGDEPGEKSDTAAASRELALQNFPPVPLRFQLFDLNTKKAIAQGDFQQRCKVPLPEQTRDAFLFVRFARQ